MLVTFSSVSEQKMKPGAVLEMLRIGAPRRSPIPPFHASIKLLTIFDQLLNLTHAPISAANFIFSPGPDVFTVTPF